MLLGDTAKLHEQRPPGSQQRPWPSDPLGTAGWADGAVGMDQGRGFAAVHDEYRSVGYCPCRRATTRWHLAFLMK